MYLHCIKYRQPFIVIVIIIIPAETKSVIIPIVFFLYKPFPEHNELKASYINKISFSIIKWKQYKHNYLHIRITCIVYTKKSEIEIIWLFFRILN